MTTSLLPPEKLFIPKEQGEMIGKMIWILFLLLSSSKSQWHKISLRLPQDQNLKVSAKEGYWQ
jgi:hypothetical protein